MYLGMCSSVVIGRNLYWRLLVGKDIQCLVINREVKLFRDRWQFELKIVCYIIPDPDTFEEALEGPLLILGSWYCL
jgi:hypothetical protein